MRADRLLSLLMLLQTQERLTARELAQQLEVSERTIYRDLEALSVAGVPVYAERGPGGGCALLDGYRSQPAGLTEAEVRALFLAAGPGPPSCLGLGAALEKALLRLLAALPPACRREAERARQRFHLDAAGWHPAGDVADLLPVIQAAIWDERRLSITWRRRAAIAAEAPIDPYGLVARTGEWYLVGAVDGATHAWPVASIRAAALTEERFARPVSFDLAAYWRDWCAQSVGGRRAAGPGAETLSKKTEIILPSLLVASSVWAS